LNQCALIRDGTCIDSNFAHGILDFADFESSGRKSLQRLAFAKWIVAHLVQRDFSRPKVAIFGTSFHSPTLENKAECTSTRCKTQRILGFTSATKRKVVP